MRKNPRERFRLKLEELLKQIEMEALKLADQVVKEKEK
jgi:hypothetical protein